jgi:hypothetical protein
MKLLPWQKLVLDLIHDHHEKCEEEYLSSLNIFHRNDAMKVRMQLPRQSGHTTLCSIISCRYNSLVIYTDHNNFNDLQDTRAEVFEHFSDMMATPSGVSIKPVEECQYASCYELESACSGNKHLQEKFVEVLKDEYLQVVVVDNACMLHPRILDLLLNYSNGKIVLLG